MKHNGINIEAERLIAEFEKPVSVIISDGWNSSLVQRMKREKLRSLPAFSLSGIAAVILLVTIVNLLFVFAALLFNPGKSHERAGDLEILGRELFINSDKLNY